MYWLCISSGIALTNMYTVASLSTKISKGRSWWGSCLQYWSNEIWHLMAVKETQQVDPMKTGDYMQVLNSSVARSFSACVAGAVSCAIRYGDVVLSKRGCSVLSMNCQKAASLWWCARRKQFFLNGTFESFEIAVEQWSGHLHCSLCNIRRAAQWAPAIVLARHLPNF